MSRKDAKTQSEIRKCLINVEGIFDYLKIIKHSITHYSNICVFAPLREKKYSEHNTRHKIK